MNIISAIYQNNYENNREMAFSQKIAFEVQEKEESFEKRPEWILPTDERPEWDWIKRK